MPPIYRTFNDPFSLIPFNMVAAYCHRASNSISDTPRQTVSVLSLDSLHRGRPHDISHVMSWKAVSVRSTLPGCSSSPPTVYSALLAGHFSKGAVLASFEEWGLWVNHNTWLALLGGVTVPFYSETIQGFEGSRLGLVGKSRDYVSHTIMLFTAIEDCIIVHCNISIHLASIYRI